MEVLYVLMDGLVYVSNWFGYMCGFDLRTSGVVFDVKVYDGGVNKIVLLLSKFYEIFIVLDDMIVVFWDVCMIDICGDVKKCFDGWVRTFWGY